MARGLKYKIRAIIISTIKIANKIRMTSTIAAISPPDKESKGDIKTGQVKVGGEIPEVVTEVVWGSLNSVDVKTEYCLGVDACLLLI